MNITRSSNKNGARGNNYNAQSSRMVESSSSSSFNPVELIIWVLFFGIMAAVVAAVTNAPELVGAFFRLGFGV